MTPTVLLPAFEIIASLDARTFVSLAPVPRTHSRLTPHSAAADNKMDAFGLPQMGRVSAHALQDDDRHDTDTIIKA